VLFFLVLSLAAWGLTPAEVEQAVGMVENLPPSELARLAAKEISAAVAGIPTLL
jgi:ABC-type nitrate/sulfonate/bicarbonate transport system substrate-binding protein